MDQETLTVFLCPYCHKEDVVCYKKLVSSRFKKRFEFAYLGFCCDYYPKENPVVESALRRLPLQRTFLPKKVYAGKTAEMNERKRLDGTIRKRKNQVEPWTKKRIAKKLAVC